MFYFFTRWIQLLYIHALKDVRWLFLLFVLSQMNMDYTGATWPSSNSSNIKLLGLFENITNESDTSNISVHSRAMFQAAVLLSQQYNITIEGQFLEWQSAQIDGSEFDAIYSTCQALFTSNIVGIVGPEFSSETPVIADCGEKVGIPVVSYAATNPYLSDRNVYPAFYRTVPSDKAAAIAIVKLFIRFQWTSGVLIYQNDAFGVGGLNAINDAFSKNGLTVANQITFNIDTLTFQSDLKSFLMTSSTRIVVLWATSTYTSLILQDALDSDIVGPQFMWILSASISLNSFNETFYPNLIGMLTIEPAIASVVKAPMNTTLLNAAYNIWQQYEPKTFPGSTEVSSYALFAFDAAWLLIQSLEKLCSLNTNSSLSCMSFTGSSFCFDRRFVNSKLLFDIVTNMSFIGVSGFIQFNRNETDRMDGTYYFSQNCRSSSNDISFVPVLTYADYAGWQEYQRDSVIIWPGESLSIPTGNAQLNGITLRVGVIESVPFTIVNIVTNKYGQNTTQLTGYTLDLIARLETNLGFIANIQLAPSNTRYDALVQAVVNGIYDIVIGDLTVTPQRTEIVGFSQGIFDNSIRLMMRNTPDVNIDFLSFLKPFSTDLWLLTLGATIFASILICLIEREENEILRNRSIMCLCAMSVWYSFGNLVGYGVDFHVSTAAGRLLTAGLYMLSIVLIASYTANLASDLTIQNSNSPISGLDDIKAGKIPFNRIGIRVSTSDEEFYLTEVSKNQTNFYPLYSRQQLYDCLLNDTIDVAFLDSGTAEYIVNNVYCNLTLVGEPFGQSILAIVTPKQWIYQQNLDVTVLTLTESGALNALQTKWFQAQICPASSISTSTAMSIQSLAGLFLVFAVITVLSLVLFIWKKRHFIMNFIRTLRCQTVLTRKTI